jgi:hypothetical protein
MSMDETSTATVTPLLLLGDASAEVCADGFCAVPPAQPEEAGPEQTGTEK